jgi:hypothetical protein
MIMDNFTKGILIILSICFILFAATQLANANALHKDKGIQLFGELMDDLDPARSAILGAYKPSDKDFVKYCDYKAYIGLAVYADKENGKSEKWAIDALTEAYNSRKVDNRVPRYVFLEHQRMARTVFRHPNLDHKQLFTRFYKECFEMGF